MTNCYDNVCMWKVCLFKIYMHKRFLISLLSDTPIFAQAKVCKLLQNNKYNFSIIIGVYMHVLYLKE